MAHSDVEILTLWIQAAAVVVAVAASIVALVISALDRRNARKIAAADRAAALRQSKLMFELEALTRLLVNANRGGSTDALERAQLGAEQLSLVGLLGEERVPKLWARKIESEEKIRRLLEDPAFPQFKRDAIEVQLAVMSVSDEIRQLIENPTDG